MKKNLTVCVLLLCVYAAHAQKHSFKITGKLTGLAKDGKVMLSYESDNAYKRDSAVTRNGAFSLSGNVERPTRATIEFISPDPVNPEWSYTEKDLARDAQEIYLEKGIVKVSGKNIKTAQVMAGKTQQQFAQLNAELKPYRDQVNAIIVKPVGDGGWQERRDVLAPMRKEMAKIEGSFMRTNPDSYVTLDMVKDKSGIIDIPTFEPLYAHLSARMKATPAGISMAAQLAKAKKTAIGVPAIDFTQNNTDNKPFTLASLRGKYVLIDFWASWCGPCRMDNPNVVKAYNSFKEKNFEIVGVSLDDKKAPWLEAIRKDNLTWIQVSDLKGWKNEVATAYGISAVPQNVLLDPNGIIIAKNLHGEELTKKLSEILK